MTPIPLSIVNGSKMTELSCGDRVHMAQKIYNTHYLTLYIKGVFLPLDWRID